MTRCGTRAQAFALASTAKLQQQTAITTPTTMAAANDKSKHRAPATPAEQQSYFGFLAKATLARFKSDQSLADVAAWLIAEPSGRLPPNDFKLACAYPRKALARPPTRPHRPHRPACECHRVAPPRQKQLPTCTLSFCTGVVGRPVCNDNAACSRLLAQWNAHCYTLTDRAD